MIDYKKVGKLAGLKYSCLHFYNKNKLKFVLVGFLIILFLLTGIFTALKVTDLEKALKLVEFSFESLMDGDVYKLSFFFKRFASILLVMALLFVFSMNKFASILGYMLLGYRAFLLALNCTLIVMYLGVGGAINSIVIILPCQLLQLILMSVLFIICMAMFREKKECGTTNGRLKTCLVYILIASVLVNIIELILLLIFKATSILII